MRWLALLVLAGCYAEVRARGERASSAGTAVGGAMFAASMGVGLDLPIDRGGRYRALAGAGGERVVAASESTDVRHANAPRLDLGVDGPWDERRFELGFSLAGYIPSNGNVSELRGFGGARFGGDHVGIIVGPTLGYWDAARRGTAVSAGAETVVRVSWGR